MSFKEEDIKKFIYKDLIFKRFKNIEDLKAMLDYFFYGCIDEETGDHLKVKIIEAASQYNNYKDPEIMAVVGTEKEDIYYITILYSRTEAKEFIIVATFCEEA